MVWLCIFLACVTTISFLFSDVLVFTELTKGEQELLAEIRQKKMQLMLEIQVLQSYSVTFVSKILIVFKTLNTRFWEYDASICNL